MSGREYNINDTGNPEIIHLVKITIISPTDYRNNFKTILAINFAHNASPLLQLIFKESNNDTENNNHYAFVKTHRTCTLERVKFTNIIFFNLPKYRGTSRKKCKLWQLNLAVLQMYGLSAPKERGEEEKGSYLKQLWKRTFWILYS